MDLFFRSSVGPGFEHVRVELRDTFFAADGLAVAANRVRYDLRCDSAWRTRAVTVINLDNGERTALVGDGAGEWTTEAGEPLPELAGCLDVDLAMTAVTNTLPIRRCALAIGESRELDVAYVAAAGLRPARARQRYTRVDRRRYRYESLTSGFVGELVVDEDGLVLDYPGVAVRVQHELAGAAGAPRLHHVLAHQRRGHRSRR